jgi:hypothetical protein
MDAALALYLGICVTFWALGFTAGRIERATERALESSL